MRVQYVVGADSAGTGRLIYTDLPQAWLRYVARITDVNMFDPIFRKLYPGAWPRLLTWFSRVMPTSAIMP